MTDRIAAVKTYLLDLQDRICAALEAEDGKARFAEDGGQLANGYRLTRAGRERLRLAIEANELSMSRRTARSRDPSQGKREPLLAATTRDRQD